MQPDGSYAYTLNPRRELVSFLPSTTTSVLDVGCGRGGFAASVRERFPDARLVGVEPVAEAAQLASEHFDEVHVGELASVPVGERFDVVAFVDVLEHVVDPWSVLELAAGRLTPSGVIVSSIPNVRNWFVVADLALRGNWTYRTSGILDRTHLRFFTRSSIDAMYRDCGYEVLRMEGINEYRGSNALRRWALRLCGDLRFAQFATVAAPLLRRSAQPD